MYYLGALSSFSSIYCFFTDQKKKFKKIKGCEDGCDGIFAKSLTKVIHYFIAFDSFAIT